MQPLKSPKILLLLLSFLILTQTNIITYPSNALSGNWKVYENPSTSLPDGSYVNIFTTTFSQTPTIVYGFNDYQMNNQFYFEDIHSYLDDQSITQFSVRITPTGATDILLLSFSYIAIAELSSYIYSTWVTLQNPATISSNTGVRTLTQNTLLPSNAPSGATFLPFITGFHIQSTTIYSININSNYFNASHVQSTISTISDSEIHSLQFYLIYYSQDALNGIHYYVLGSPDIYTSTASADVSFDGTLDNFATTVYIIGLRSFEGISSDSKLTLGWFALSSSGSLLTIQFRKQKLESIGYSVFQLGKYQSVASTSDAESGDSSIILVIAVIATVIIIIVSIIVIYRQFFRRKKIQIPNKDIFRQLPKISL